MKFQIESQSIVKLTLTLLCLTCPTASLFAATTTATPVVATRTTHRPIDYKSMAIAAPVETSGFNGWSVGIGLGVMTSAMNTSTNSNMHATESPFISGGIPGNTSNSSARQMVYKFGPMGNVFAGYGYLQDIYYAGASLGVNVLGASELQSNHTATNNNITTTSGADLAFVNYTSTMQTQTKVSRGWAEPFLDIKLGGLITPDTLAYAILGTSYNSATIKSNAVYSTNGVVETIIGVPPAVTTLSSTSSFSSQRTKYFFGLRLGAGMEVLLTQRFGIAADYVYSFYPTYNTSNTTTTTTVACDPVAGCQAVPSTVTNNTQTSLSDQQIMAKFVYHFE